ncbi:MAG: thiosulfate sulfurtransferase [Betaproteobacteria bacterium]|nr:thiosulfate sulfurtransferase [Betaproteobacteria bacterium]
MSNPVKSIDAKTLKAALHDGGEIALLDAREEVPFDARHMLMAACVPLSRLELIVDASVPRRSARVVWCDDGEGLAQRAAARMTALEYGDVAVLTGGVSAWEKAGYAIYSGVHVPSKAFAEVVEHEAGTPWITAEELKKLIDDKADIALFDSRSFEEFHVNSIPTAISVPGAELVYRFADMVPSPKTMVIVNCGGRTRSIIGAQSLINAGVPNKVVSLKNGTQAWHLSGYQVLKGSNAKAPNVTPAGHAQAKAAADRVAQKFGIARIDAATLAAWQAEAQRTTYVIDVRDADEYAAGHLAGMKNVPGGQLIQETDRHCATWGARVVLVDDDGVRAVMTAHWMKQMGWDAAAMTIDLRAHTQQGGAWQPRALGLQNTVVPTINAAALRERFDAGNVTVLDVDWSRDYLAGHIPGAWFGLRARLGEILPQMPASHSLVITSGNGILAKLAALDVKAAASIAVQALEGGTNAWRQAGFPLEQGATRMACTPDDIRLRAREQNQGVEEAMNAYLTWEINLANQMAADDDKRFRILRG